MDCMRGTYRLKSAEGTGQDRETNWASKGHPLPEELRGRNKSGHGKKTK
jgi:hypothetical protein